VKIGADGRGTDTPYPGARPFLQSEQDLFFGRDAESTALAEFWQDNRVVLLAGPTASGKTSLLHAGVLPILTRNRERMLPVGSVSSGARFPTAVLPEHNPYTLALLRSWSPGEAPARLVDLTVGDFIRAHGQCHDGLLYVAIDRLDDLPADSSPRRDHRDRFLAELADAVETQPRLHLLLLARELAADLICARLGKAARFDLATLTRQSAIEAVAGPAASTSRSFSGEAAEKLVTDLLTTRVTVGDGVERSIRDDRVEPSLLQAACVRLWNSLPSGTERITTRDVRLFGDADKALARYCGRVVASVADDFAQPVTLVRQRLLRAFITDLGTRGTAYEGAAETAGMPNAIARALADRQLLSVRLRSGARWYELLSDRLIQPLRDAVDEMPPAVEPAQHLAAAERALARGELDVAQRYAEAALRDAAETELRLRAEIESLLGNIAAEDGESPAAKAEAESHYRAAARYFEALRDTPAVASQLAAVGQMLIAQQRTWDAVGMLTAARDRTPGDPVIQTDLALALWALGESRAAVSTLNDVLANDGGNTVALRARGEILAELGEAKAAMHDLNRVTLDERPATRAARGLALARLGDRSGADVDVDDAVTEAPWNGAVLLHAAQAKALNGDEAAAEELARRAVDASDPGLPPYHREVALQLAGHKHGNRRA
jgi:tetratricopeptide (TPR) repeat protein